MEWVLERPYVGGAQAQLAAAGLVPGHQRAGHHVALAGQQDEAGDATHQSGQRDQQQPAGSVLRRGGPVARMMGLLYCAAGVTLAYAMALGTLEEHELYLLVVPSLIMISVGFTLWHKASHARPRSAARAFIVVKTAAIMATLAVVFGLNVKTGVQWLRQPDDGYARLLPYLAANVPPGTAVDIPAASLPLSRSEAAAIGSHYTSCVRPRAVRPKNRTPCDGPGRVGSRTAASFAACLGGS